MTLAYRCAQAAVLTIFFILLSPDAAEAQSKSEQENSRDVRICVLQDDALTIVTGSTALQSMGSSMIRSGSEDSRWERAGARGRARGPATIARPLCGVVIAADRRAPRHRF